MDDKNRGRLTVIWNMDVAYITKLHGRNSYGETVMRRSYGERKIDFKEMESEVCMGHTEGAI